MHTGEPFWLGVGFSCEQGASPKGIEKLKNLIKTVNGEPVVSTDVVAAEFGRRHDNVMQNIRSLIETGHLGALDFKESSYLNKQNKSQPCFELTERGFLIAMPFIGGDKAKDGQVKLVDSFISFRKKISEKESDRVLRDNLSVEYRPMTDAIKLSREQAGKKIERHHFSNEADLINRIALGMTAAKFKAHHELSKDANIRDYLTPEQMRCVMDLQRANTVFISMGWDFQKRKDELHDLFNANHCQKLIDEVHRLEA